MASFYLVGYHNFRLQIQINSQNIYFFFLGAYSLPNLPTKSSATSGKYLVNYQKQGFEYWNGYILKGQNCVWLVNVGSLSYDLNTRHLTI